MLKLQRLLVAAFFLFPVVRTTAAEPLEIVDTAEKYRQLVAQLVSTNDKPMTHVDGDETKVRFPANYDREAQRRINQVRVSLHDEFEAALPYLAEALNDDRYCLTVIYAEGDAYYNFSVGRICRDLLESRLEVYRRHLRFSGPGDWNRYRFPITKEWQQARANRTLAELQIEVIDWVVAKRKADTRAAETFDVAAELESLQKLRESLVQSKKPLEGNRIIPMILHDRG